MSHMDYILLEWEMDREIRRRRKAARIELLKRLGKIATGVVLFVICLIMAWFWGEANDYAHAEGLSRIRNGVAPIIAEEPEEEYAYDFSEDDEWVLLHVMQAEAGNQGITGMCYVGRVLINRREQPERFHCSTLREVAEAPGQFSTVRSGSWYREPNADCYEALELLRYGWDESQGAVFFRTASGHFSWAEYMYTYGNHNFYR